MPDETFTVDNLLVLADSLLSLVRILSVAEVNTALVDDGLVDKAKIGGSNYFWSFPAKKDRLAQIQHQERLERIEQLKVQMEESNAQLADAKRGREEQGGDRATKLQRLSDISQERTTAERELEKLRENDPQVLADLEKELRLVTEAANRWTDNIFNCKSYLVKKRGMDKKQVDRLLGITSAFDCKFGALCVLIHYCNVGLISLTVFIFAN